MSIEAMKRTRDAVQEIIESCHNVRKANDVHKESKRLAFLVGQDCASIVQDLSKEIEQGEKNE